MTSQPTSKTPRTDEKQFAVWPEPKGELPAMLVYASFARTLETELNDALEKLSNYSDAYAMLENKIVGLEQERDAAVAAKHKERTNSPFKQIQEQQVEIHELEQERTSLQKQLEEANKYVLAYECFKKAYHATPVDYASDKTVECNQLRTQNDRLRELLRVFVKVEHTVEEYQDALHAAKEALNQKDDE